MASPCVEYHVNRAALGPTKTRPGPPQSLAAALRAATLAYELRAAAPEPLPDPEPDFLAGATAEQLHRLSALFAEITVDSEDRARRTGERANPMA